MAAAGTYSDYTDQPGGIGYRLDFENGQSYTTNPDGSGLFFHNGLGDRRQIRGNGQFQSRSLTQFKRKIINLLGNP
jgi:hypothetical protein